MLLTLLNRVFQRSTSNESQHPSISIKIFLYCSIPAMLFSSSLTLFITSMGKDSCITHNCTALVIGDQVFAELSVRYPLPDSYVKSLTLKPFNKTEIIHGKDVCILKNFLKNCLMSNCQYKTFSKSEIVSLYEMFEKIVLC